MSLLPAHPRRNGAADDERPDERPTDDAHADDERTATGATDGQPGQAGAGRSTERPRYAFAYAPAADPPDDDASDDVPHTDDPRDPDTASNGAPARNVVAGNVVTGRVVASDSADEDGADEPAVTRPNPIPGRAGPAATKPAPVSRLTPPAPAAPAAPASAQPVPPTVPVPSVAPPTVETPVTGMNRSATGGDGTTVPAPRPGTEPEAAAADAAGIDEPLLADAAALRARWQRAQSDFVDDPRAAVGDAAALVAQTAQAMIDALEQRQRLLRQEWEHSQQRERGRGKGRGDGSVPDDPGDTERLRLTMLAYRALFNQICAR